MSFEIEDSIGLCDIKALNTRDAYDEKPSLLYALLPEMLKARVRQLPSLRSSVSNYYAIHSYGTDPPIASKIPRKSYDSCCTAGLATPPPEYRSRNSSSRSASDNEEFLDEPLPRPLSSCSSLSPCDNEDGIQWRFANQGTSLLHLAANEDSRRPSRRASSSSTSLSRQLYVHGLTYLLRGLPSDLSVDEKISVYSALPVQVHDVQLVIAGSSTALLRIEDGTKQTVRETSESRASLLQRTVASLVVRLFILTQFLLPYLQHLFAMLYRFEREHRISERLLLSSLHACEGLLNTGLQMSSFACKIRDGRIGQSIKSLAIWWFEGVTNGINQGVDDGLTVVGFDKGSIER